MQKTKSMIEMDFDGFHDQSSRMIADAIIRGGFQAMKNELHLILAQTCQNRVFGGCKQK